MSNEEGFWQTKQGKAIVKMGGWLFFMVVLIIAFVVQEKSKPKTEKPIDEVETFKKYDIMQEELINSGYNYKYEINTNDIKYIFEGSYCSGENVGFKETSDKIVKYKIKDNKIYEDKMGELIELNSIDENINYEYLDINLLFNELKDNLYNIKKEENTRTIIYNKDNYQIEVKTDKEKIDSIMIIDNNSVYNLKFMNIGYCK